MRILDLPHGSETGVCKTSISSGPEASRSVSKIGCGGKAHVQDLSGLSVTELTEKWLKTRDDAILNVLKTGDEDFARRAFPQGSNLVEEYVSGTACLNADIILKETGGYRQRYHLNLSAVLGQQQPKMKRSLAGGDYELGVFVVAESDVASAMLICIAQLVKDGEGIYFRQPIPSKARLEILDEGNGVIGNTAKVVFPLFIPLINLPVDRELSMGAGGLGRLLSDQTADQIIQGGSHVMDTVADNCAEVNWRKWVIDPPHKERRVVIFIDLHAKGIFYRFEKIACLDIEFCQVYVSPGDFGVNALQPR